MGRRARLVGLAIVLAAGTAVGLTVSGIGGSPHPRAAPTPAAGLVAMRAYTIVYTGSDGVQVVSLSGDRESRPITAPTGPPLQTGSGIAFVSSDTLYLLAAPFTDPRRTSLDADRLFPMLWPGTVGVANDVAQNTVRVQYVDLQGNSLVGGSGWELPSGYRPVSQFLATGPEGSFEPWDPGPAGRARAGPGHRPDTLSGSAGPTLRWWRGWRATAVHRMGNALCTSVAATRPRRAVIRLSSRRPVTTGFCPVVPCPRTDSSWPDS